MTDIKMPVRALRSWEGYFTPDDDELGEYMARPFTRIEAADGESVFYAHDCFEFAPGVAEEIVRRLNAYDELVKALKEIAEHDWYARDGWRQYGHCGRIALAALDEMKP